MQHASEQYELLFAKLPVAVPHLVSYHAAAQNSWWRQLVTTNSPAAMQCRIAKMLFECDGLSALQRSMKYMPQTRCHV